MSSLYRCPAKSHQVFVFFIIYSFNLETYVSLRRCFRLPYYISNAKPNQNLCKAVFLNFSKITSPF